MHGMPLHESPSQYGIVTLSALLTYDVAGAFGFQEGMRLLAVAPKVLPVAGSPRGWELTIDPAASAAPAVGTVLMLITDVGLAKYQARFLLDLTPGGKPLVFLCDTTTGFVVDPATVAAAVPGAFFGVQIHAVSAGSSTQP
jgi:hypothetical protein